MQNQKIWRQNISFRLEVPLALNKKLNERQRANEREEKKVYDNNNSKTNKQKNEKRKIFNHENVTSTGTYPMT